MIQCQNLMTHLDTVVARSNSPALNLHIGWGMCKLAFSVRPRALASLELPAYFKLQPTRVLPVQEVVHIDHCHV